MNITEIHPYIRYARRLSLNENSCFNEAIPLDARLFYTVRGWGKITVQATEYEMQPYSLLIINAGIPYRIETPDAPVEYIVLNFDYSQNAMTQSLPVTPVSAEHFKPDMLLDPHTFDDAPELSKVLYIKQIEGLQKKLSAILDEYTRRILYYESKSGHILAECIFECMRLRKTGDFGIKKSPVDRILAFIHTNYTVNLTNSAIGNQFGYHPNYISFIIKQITGMPLHQYLIHIRLMHAADLLEAGMFSVSKIAEQCGFCDISYFSKCFKKHFGINPSEYSTRS